VQATPYAGVFTTESGGKAKVSVVLTLKPTANVTVKLSSSDKTEGTVTPTSLTFTPANWKNPQVVTVTGVDDSIADGAIDYSVVTAPAISADPRYSGFDPDDVQVINFDNEFAPVAAILPLGSLIYSSSLAGGIAASGNVETYSLSVDPGQTITMIVHPAGSGLKPVIQLVEGGSTVVGTATAGGAGQDAVIQTVATPGQLWAGGPGAKTYQIGVSGAAATTGRYSIQVILNSAVENESHSGAANDTRAKAQSLEPSFLSLTSASSCSSISSDAGRAAVLGRADITDADYYSFSLAAGGTATFGLVDLSGPAPALTLEDSTGTALAVGRTGATNVGQVINTFVAAKSGTYYVRITGADPAGTDYSVVVTRNAEFDTENNDTTSTAQDLIGPEVSARRWAMGSIDSTLGSPADFYRITAASNDTIEIETETPASKSGQFANGFDPALRLYDQAGNLVASNDNGASDKRNAKISYKVPKTKGGTYTIQVVASTITPVPTTGEYVLAVKAATGLLPAFKVTTTDIPDNTTFRYPPTSIQLDFNDVILLTSLQASDVKVDGKAVTGFTVVDGDTVVLALPGTLADGLHTVTIASGAISDVQKTPLAAFMTHYSTDQTSPRVVFSSIQQNDILAPGSLTYTVKFSEPMQTTFLDSYDFALTGVLTSAIYTPTSFGFDASGRTLTIQYAGLPEDNYALTLASGDYAFEDVGGNNLDGEALAWPIPTHVSGDGVEGGNFEVDFTMDVGTAAYPTPLSPKPPLGSLIHDSSVWGATNFAGDTDRYTLSLDAGQTMSVSVRPGSPAFGANPLAPTIELRDPSNHVIASATADPGNEAILQTVPIATAGTYTITLGGAAGTTGLFTAAVTLNAAVELESHGGPSNETPTAAQNIDPSFIALLKGASRGAVLGTSGNTDVYSFTLQAGHALSADLVFPGGAPAQTFGARTDYSEYAPAWVALGDINNDGNLDMVDGSSFGSYLTVWLGNGDGSFGAAGSFGSGSNTPQQIALSDLNGDGDLDVVAANYFGGLFGSGSVTVMLGHGDGTFDPPVGYSAGVYNVGLAIGDVDGDGKPDIVTTAVNDSTVHVLRNNGDGTFGPDASYLVASDPNGVALGDFNGDGALDIVTTSFNDSSGNLVIVLLNHGDGAFDAGVHYFAGYYTYAVAVGDVNADGALDIVATNYYDNTVAVLDNNGDGTFASPSFYNTTGYYPVSVALGDVNGDGALDVVVGSNDNNSFSIGNISTLLNDGGGSFGPASATDAGYDTNSVALGDLDGDGRPDLVTANQYGSSLSVFLNQSKPVTLELIGPDGVTVLASAAIGHNDQAAISNYIAAVSGTYYLRVSGPPVIQSYTLLANRDAEFDLGGNDTLDMAQPLGPVHVALGYVSATDDVSDFYSFDATAGQTLELYTITPADGPGEFGNTLTARLVLHGPDGSTIFGTPTSDGRNEKIIFTATVGGTYVVAVSAEAGTSGEYILDPSPVLMAGGSLVSQGVASTMPAVVLTPVITLNGGLDSTALRSGVLGAMPSNVLPASRALSNAMPGSTRPRRSEATSPLADRLESRASVTTAQQTSVTLISPAPVLIRLEESLSRTANARNDRGSTELPWEFLDGNHDAELGGASAVEPSLVGSQAGAMALSGQADAGYADGEGVSDRSIQSASKSFELVLGSAAGLAAIDLALLHFGGHAARRLGSRGRRVTLG
jgi:FG-GAP-like repeat/Bacterial pre-peptidase C-terminal domain/FG-GAP repeat